MRKIITKNSHLSKGEGPFDITRIRPGFGINEDDNGFGPLGLVDRARLEPGVVVDMHEHVDDEIISYLRTGELVHEDSDGNTETVTPERLMVMNAGRGFSHEESLPDDTDSEDIDMLQIFVRPRKAGLQPNVQFAGIEESARNGAWRSLVQPDTDDGSAPTTVRQDLWLFDTSIDTGTMIQVPDRARSNQWIYVFNGSVTLDGTVSLEKGEAIAVSADERVSTISAVEKSDIVLFEMSENAEFTLEGSLSRGR